MFRTVLFLALTAICPTQTWADGRADQSFIAGDYATARSIWTAEAAAGSAEAMLGLGLLADRGHGQSRDLGLAYNWYLKAAQAGLAEAQFNVAVMLDAGLGQPRDAKAAQVWYTRAALRDHARAQYNLALLFETGDGLTANPQLARYWFDRAASDVPAATNRTPVQVPVIDGLATPEILFAEHLDNSLEVVWSAPPSASANYVVEAVAVPDTEGSYAAPFLFAATEGSGMRVSAPIEPSHDFMWRVLNFSADQASYTASGWHDTTDHGAPDGRITLLHDADVASMAEASQYFAATLRAAGFWVRTDVRSGEPQAYVGYGYAADAGFAQKVADFLPTAPDAGGITQITGFSQPGEIIIDLAAFR